MEEIAEPQPQLIEIRHTNPNMFLNWEIFINGRRLEEITGFELKVGMDDVPKMTVHFNAIDVKIDDVRWNPYLAPGVQSHLDGLRTTIEQDQQAVPDPWEDGKR